MILRRESLVRGNKGIKPAGISGFNAVKAGEKRGVYLIGRR
jgi:hypothetical protein